MIYTLKRDPLGASFIFSRRSRISSIPLLLAASISSKSKCLASFIARQVSHSLQGSPNFRSEFFWFFAIRWQLIALAKILAVEVFPIPRGPEKRKAWGNLQVDNCLSSVSLICSCPNKSANLAGLYLRYNTVITGIILALQSIKNNLSFGIIKILLTIC